jgi:oligopeptide/dipeptide ABC transporter ATP-binding protein
VTPVTEQSTPVLRLRGVCTHFPVRGGFLGSLVGRPSAWVRAVDGVDVEVFPDEILGLVGESGSGKTTLGRTMLRLVEPVAGTIEFEGKDITHMSEPELRPLRRRMQPVFQDPHAALNPAMTVGDAVAHPLRIHGLASDPADARAQAAEMLERVGIAPASAFLDRYPEDLSGGQKQRVVIARALVTRPRLVVADEPVAMLDMSVRAKILELLLELKRDLGLTYVFITHDLATAKFVCDRIAILYLGKVVETGPAAAVYGAPQHPYTRALLEAVPSPDPSRRNPNRRLPSGDVPDAVDPPLGCRFHPRCPSAFGPCGWEGRDLIAALEEHWADPTTFAAEASLVECLSGARLDREGVYFPNSGEDLTSLLRRLQESGAHPVFSGVASIARRGPGVEVRMRPGSEPALQPIGRQHVACHLHGVTSAALPAAGEPPSVPGRDAGEGKRPPGRAT